MIVASFGHIAPVSVHDHEQERLDAAHLGAHRPVAQDAQPARVGRHRAAGGGAVPAGDEDAEVQAGIGLGEALQRHAGVRGYLGRLRVDRVHPHQPGQAEDDLAVQRNAATDQAGVSSLRDHRDPGIRAQGQDARNLGEDPCPLPAGRHNRQLLQVLPDPHEDVLHQVGGRLRVAGPAGEVGVHRGAVRLVEAAELSFPVHRWPGWPRTRRW
jgi:hypothetical protein